jgi:adenylate cyclase class 2
MIEIERKFRLTPAQKNSISDQLQSQYGPLETVHQIDQVFLQGIDSFAEFTKGQPVVRLRTMNGKTEFTYKRGINGAGDSIEHELDVSSAEAMQAILREMDYRPVTEIVKDRVTAKTGDRESDLAVMLDSVEGLGDFLEIEVLAANVEAQPAAEQQIMDKAAEFGLTASDIETKKYDQLVSVLARKP